MAYFETTYIGKYQCRPDPEDQQRCKLSRKSHSTIPKFGVFTIGLLNQSLEQYVC